MLLPVALLMGACAGSQNPGPGLASSASSLTYASEWTERVKSASGRYEQRVEQIRIEIEGIPTYHESLEDPDWAGVASIINAADSAGRSVAMVEALDEARHVIEFLDKNQRPITWRINSNVKAALEKRKCKCNWEGGRYGQIVADTARRNLDKRRRELNEAFRLLENEVHGESEANGKALESQIEAISGASYFVNVEAFDLRDRLDILLDDQRRVRRTLDAALEEERQDLEAYEGRKGGGKALSERVSELEKAREPFEKTLEDARALRGRMDEEILEFQTDYTAAVEQLLDVVEGRR